MSLLNVILIILSILGLLLFVFGLQMKKGMSIVEADESIKESLDYYKQLEHLVEMNGKQRDTSIYYNWLEEK